MLVVMALKKSVTTVSLIRVSSMVVWSWPGINMIKSPNLICCGSHLKHLRVMGLEKSVTGEYSLVSGLLMITGWGSFGRLSHGSPWSASPVLFSTSSAQLVKQHHQMVLMMITILKWLLYPYTAERRGVLGYTSPEDREISQGRGFCTPRPDNVFHTRMCSWYSP